MLRGQGYEITRAPGGGYAFERTPALPPVTLSMQEVLALTLAAELARKGNYVDMESPGVVVDARQRL
jgi:hypothetical protein